MAKKKAAPPKPPAPKPKAPAPAPKPKAKVPPKPPGKPYLWSNKTWHERPEGKQYRTTAPKYKTSTISRAPAGSYDPGFDAQERAAGRGLGDLLDDVEREGMESTTDYTLSGIDFDRQQAELNEDYGEATSDVERDYKVTIDDMLRNYRNLATGQAGQQRAAGLYGGGAAQQAAEKRAGNQAIEQERADYSRGESLDDLLRQHTRGTEGIQRGEGALALQYERGRNVREAITVPRAQREFGALKQDLGESRMAQFLQGGGSTTVRTKVKPKPLPKPKVWNRQIRKKLRF